MSEETHAGDGQAGGVATAHDTLSVTDNRTGKTYEVDITDGTVRAMDFRQMKVDEDDFGLMTYDPAFTNTASTRSAITYIDGDKGILEYRGYPIEQLAEQSTYLEDAYLLAVDEQVGDLEVRGLLGELLDRIPAVLEDPLVAVDVRDRRARRRGVRERRVVGHQAEVVLVDLHLAEVHGTDGPVRDVDLVGLAGAVVRDRQR